MVLNKESLFRPRRKQISLPDSDGEILIRELTSREVAKLKERALAAANPDADGLEMTAAIVGLGVIDESGKPIFGETEADSPLSLGTSRLVFIARAIAEFSGIALGGGSADQPKAGPTAGV